MSASTKPSCIAWWYHLCDITAGVIGIAVCCILLYLILTRSSGIVRAYRRIMLFSCVLDMLYASSTIFLSYVSGLVFNTHSPVPLKHAHIRNGVVFGVVIGLIDVPREASFVLQMISVQNMQFVMACSTVPAIFRYSAFCR